MQFVDEFILFIIILSLLVILMNVVIKVFFIYIYGEEAFEEDHKREMERDVRWKN